MFENMKLKSLQKKIYGLQKARENNPVSDSELKKEINYAKDLGAIFDKLQFSKKFPYARLHAIEAYRLAATLDDMEAQYIIAKRLIEQGKFWDELSEGIFDEKYTKSYAKAVYGEAFGYLKAAEHLGHIKAKRLHGLCYINGWGVEPDLDQGIKLVVSSIEQEGAWDRATEIFKELGLNKPEFFSYIMSNKGKNES